MALLMTSTSMLFADLIDITPHENFFIYRVSSTFIMACPMRDVVVMAGNNFNIGNNGLKMLSIN